MSHGNAFSEDPSIQQQIPHRSSGNSVLVIVAAVGGVLVLLCGGLVALLVIPAVGGARAAAERMRCSNNLKQITLALHNYHDVWGAFPPAFTVNENGEPLHSWRTLILPYMEQQNLYKRIDLTKPWDDPVNQQFAEMTIPTYQCSSIDMPAGMTNYVAIVDPEGIFSGPTPTKIRDVVDGTSNTLIVIEVGSSDAVPWMSPEDTDRSKFASAQQHGTGWNCALADGSIMHAPLNVDREKRDALITKAGGDEPSYDMGM